MAYYPSVASLSRRYSSGAAEMTLRVWPNGESTHAIDRLLLPARASCGALCAESETSPDRVHRSLNIRVLPHIGAYFNE